MELDARKMRILQAIIDDYILTASPVGSRTIAKSTDIGLSSATIRNEMSDLEEMGFLEQPHTSAGRIPSDKAYRLYVDSIMRRSQLSRDELSFISEHYSKKLGEVDDIVKQTAFVLSSVTRYASMVLSPRLHTARLRYIHLVGLGEGKALLLIVTDSGLTRDSLIRVPYGMEQSELERISLMLNAKLSDCRLDDIMASRMDDIAGELGEHAQFLNSIIKSLGESLEQKAKRVELSGAMNLLSLPEYSDVDRAKDILSVMEKGDALYEMLKGREDVEFTIKIGHENELSSMKDCSVVTATYKIGSEPIGTFGVIGPTRLNYPKVLAVMGHIGRTLSETLTNMLDEERK